jgi:hypothetical protein
MAMMPTPWRCDSSCPDRRSDPSIPGSRINQRVDVFGRGDSLLTAASSAGPFAWRREEPGCSLRRRRERARSTNSPPRRTARPLVGQRTPDAKAMQPPGRQPNHDRAALGTGSRVSGTLPRPQQAHPGDSNGSDGLCGRTDGRLTKSTEKAGACAFAVAEQGGLGDVI